MCHMRELIGLTILFSLNKLIVIRSYQTNTVTIQQQSLVAYTTTSPKHCTREGNLLANRQTETYPVRSCHGCVSVSATSAQLTLCQE